MLMCSFMHTLVHVASTFVDNDDCLYTYKITSTLVLSLTLFKCGLSDLVSGTLTSFQGHRNVENVNYKSHFLKQFCCNLVVWVLFMAR